MSAGPAAPALAARLRERTPELVAALEALVGVETPSGDPAALERGFAAVDALCTAVLGATPVRLGDPDAPCLRLDLGAGPPRVLLLGHVDTVWPVGTLARMPFAVADGRASGPGCFDMKAGIVQGLFALAALEDPSGACLLLTSDEETGSQRSRAAIEDAARQVEAVLVLEPSADGALKTARKGVGTYELTVTGRAAHAGLEPHAGANAAVALAHLTLAAGAVAAGLDGATVTPTLATAGHAMNVVPDAAALTLDARMSTLAHQREIEARLAEVAAPVAGTSVALRVVQRRPPLEPSASAALFVRAARAAEALGLEPLRGVAVGGGSDGSFTAALGVPTLDGLGAVGGGAHAPTEHVIVERLPERAALVAALTAELLAARPPHRGAPDAR